jgi:hypothetical protein
MAMPQDGAPGPESPAPQEGGGAEQLLKSAFESLLQLFSAMRQSQGADPEALKKLGMIMKAIQALGQEMSGGGAPEQSAPGVSSPEAGANPNARPAM